MTTERLLPHNLEAERAVLGAILIDNDAFPVAASVVQSRHFFRKVHSLIFDRMVHLADARQPIELVTLKDDLVRAGQLEEVGGPSYLAELLDGVPHATNVEYYARIVRDKFQLRSLIHLGSQVMTLAYAGEEDVESVIDRAERWVMDIGRATARGEFVLAEDWFRETYALITHAIETRRIVTGVSTSLPTLDRQTRGLQRSDLIYLGARPSVGKTALMLQMALHAADDVMTGIVSLEMARRVVGQRAVAVEAKVDLFRLMIGHLTEREQQYIGQALTRLGEKRLAIDDASGITATQLCAKVRRLAARYGLGIVFIDYMQLIQAAQRADNRNLELAGISAALKALAKDLDIPVVVLSQLSRDASKTNRRPMLADLRDSGALEQDADVVLLLHRPKTETGDGEEAELIVEKQRNGPTGTIKLRWFGEQVRFGEIASEPSQASLV